MSKADEYRQRRNNINKRLSNTINDLQKGENEAGRVAEIAENSREILDDLDRRFCEETGLTDGDVALLFLAIGLQIARQYIVSNDKFRLSHNDGDDMMNNVVSKITPPSWQEVLKQKKIPYDCVTTKGTLKKGHVHDTGISGGTHRYRTLGHDPLLGLIFGTANIMTNSLTKTNGETYQINMDQFIIVRHYPSGTIGMLKRAAKYAADDPKLLVAALARQIVHIGSDIFTKQGLPVPVIATVNNDLAKDMITKWNIDTYSVIRGAGLAVYINVLISAIHGLSFPGGNDMDRKLYEVRTRKIVLYSNLVATSSNVAVVAITRDLKKLDIGGMAVAIYNLITSKKFISEVKDEFIFGSFRKMIESEEYSIN